MFESCKVSRSLEGLAAGDGSRRRSGPFPGGGEGKGGVLSFWRVRGGLETSAEEDSFTDLICMMDMDMPACAGVHPCPPTELGLLE